MTQTIDTYSILTTLAFLKANSAILAQQSDNMLNAALDAASHQVCMAAGWTADLGIVDYHTVLGPENSFTMEAQMAALKTIEFYLTDPSATASPALGSENQTSGDGGYSWSRIVSAINQGGVPAQVRFLIHKPWSHFISTTKAVRPPRDPREYPRYNF